MNLKSLLRAKGMALVGVAIVVGAASIAALNVNAAGRTQYKAVYLDGGSRNAAPVQQVLDQHSAQGWELVAVGGGPLLIFKSNRAIRAVVTPNKAVNTGAARQVAQRRLPLR